MVNIAILNAKYHGIDLHHGVPNLANGDCAIEAIADNISTRPEFGEVFNGGSEFNRRMWMEEAEDLVYNFSGGAGMSEQDFRKQWDLLKRSGNYEYELGDYVIAAIAHCTRKDILIFHTRGDGQLDPISVVQAVTLGNRPANSDIPVLLAYNQVHFEGLVPNTPLDLQKTVHLKMQYITNKYTIQKKDIPVFATQQLTYAQTVRKSQNLAPENMKTSKNTTKQSSNLRNENGNSQQSSSEAKKRIKIKDMTPEEKRHYKRVKEQERREKMDNAKKRRD